MLERYGDLTVLPTRLFWYGLSEEDEDVSIGLGRGVRVLVGLEAIGEPDEDGIRSVMFRLNGQFRPIDAIDRSVATATTATEKADSNRAGHVAAPFRGLVSVKTEVGAVVEVGQLVATIEAMKMESRITAPIAGVVERVVVGDAASVEPGDLILEIRVAGTPASPVIDVDHS
jgi:pyruvate carboxylase